MRNIGTDIRTKTKIILIYIKFELLAKGIYLDENNRGINVLKGYLRVIRNLPRFCIEF